jgi:hypothetical protein
LFLVRRERIWMTRSISLARPITGSSLLRARGGRQVHAELVDDRGSWWCAVTPAASSSGSGFRT